MLPEQVRGRMFVSGAARRVQILTVLLAASAAAGQPCGDAPTFETGLAPGAEVFVSPSGSNSSGAGTMASPYQTIAFAAGTAQPGTAVRLLPGLYPGGAFLTDLAGTAQAPVWIGGVPGMARPVIEGATEGLHLVRPRFVVVHDLEVRGASGNGINADDGGEYGNPLAAHHVVFRDLFIHDIGGTGNQDGLKLSGLNEFWVIGCTIARTGGGGSGSGIDMVGCHQGLIDTCRFEEMSGNAVQAKGGTENVEIRRCWVEDGGHRAFNAGGSTGFAFFRPPLSPTQPNFEAKNIRIVSNVTVGGNTPVAFVGCVDCIAMNNTFVTPSQWLMRILQETVSGGGYTFLPSSGGVVRNNIFYFSRGQISTYVNIGANTAPQTFTFDRNLWYAHDNPALSAATLPVAETGQIAGVAPGFFPGSYQIGSESPGAGSGAPEAAGLPDIAGRCRPPSPARGAYEPCDANCDGSTAWPVLNVADFGCFLLRFAAGDAYANCDGSTSSPVLNVADFGCYLGKFAAGCP